MKTEKIAITVEFSCSNRAAAMYFLRALLQFVDSAWPETVVTMNIDDKMVERRTKVA